LQFLDESRDDISEILEELVSKNNDASLKEERLFLINFILGKECSHKYVELNMEKN